MKNRVSLFIFWLLVLALTYPGRAVAQEAAPPSTRYQDPLLTEVQWWAPPHELAAPRQTEIPAWFMPWSLVVYQSLQNHKDWNIYLLNPQGHHIQLTNEPSHEIHPRLNRGATQVVFASNRTGHFELYRMLVDGSALTQLTATGSDNLHPAWSFDGQRIAFNSYHDGQSEIYVMDADGGNLQRLTASPGYDGQPSWSPDGRQLAYVSEVEGLPHVWVMDANGSHARLLTPQVSTKPVWSPSGKEIAYAADSDGDGWFELWMADANGENPRRLHVSVGQHTDLIPQSWSPDGHYVAYTRIDYLRQQNQWFWESAKIEAVSAQYGRFEFISGHANTEWFPDWQTLDASAPTSTLAALPALSPAEVQLSWQSVDSGEAGVAAYQIQVRQGEDSGWTEWQTETADTKATFMGMGGKQYFFRLRARDHAYNWEPWPENYDAVTTVESMPPRSQWAPMPSHTRGDHLQLRWSSTDPGDSGVESYDLQVRALPQEEWSELVSAQPWPELLYEGVLGKRYEFRLRARDRAGNLEAWSASPAATTFYTWGITGTVVDNAGAPVTDAAITAEPAAFELLAESTGAYAAYVADAGAESATVTVTWQKSGYGDLPVTHFPAAADARRNIVLPPANNLLINSYFEGQTLAESWQSSGEMVPTLQHEYFHTGEASALFGCPAFTPVVNLSPDVERASHQEMAIDVTGAVHLVWRGDHEDLDNGIYYRGIYYRQRTPDGVWQMAEKLSTIDAWTEPPQLVVDEAGMVHVIWSTYGGNVNAIYYTGRTPGGAWSPPQELSLPNTGNGNASLDIDSDGHLHVVWIQATTTWNVAYASRDTTGQWSTPILLNDSNFRAQSPRLLVTKAGVVHVIWHQEENYSFEVVYRRRDSQGDWGTSQNLSQSPVNSTISAFEQAVDGHLHLVWAEQAGEVQDLTTTVLHRQQDEAGKWSEAQTVFSSPRGFDSDAGFAVNAQGELVLLLHWRDEGLVSYVERRQGQWSTPVVLLTEPVFGRMKLTFDSTGTLHLFWIGYENGAATRIFHRWREPDNVWRPAQWLVEARQVLRDLQVVTGAQGGFHATWLQGQPTDYDKPIVLYTISTGMSRGGSSTLAQTVTIPAQTASPNLSFQSWSGGFGRQPQSNFMVEVSDAFSATTLSTITHDSDGWVHGWHDLSAWQGLPITITMRLDQPANRRCTWVLVDEVTLGTAYPDLWISAAGTPTALPGGTVRYTLTVGNRGGGVTGAKVTAVLPDQVSLVNATIPPTVHGKTLSWEIGQMPAQSPPLQIAITGTVDASGTMMSHLKLSTAIEATTPELELANNQVELATFIGHLLHLPAVHRE